MGIRNSDVQAKLNQKIRNARRAFTSWREFKDWVQVADTALDQVRIRPPTPSMDADSLYSMAIAKLDLSGQTRISIPRRTRNAHGDGGIT